MAEHSKTAFAFGPEFRARLRELRKSRGLTLRAMALLMDRPGSGAHVQLARLEKGEVKYPSINLIADYLRACGAGFEDLFDLLKSQTAQPPVLKQKGDVAVAELLKMLPKAEQRAMLKWEKATVEAREGKAASVPEKKKPKPETDRQRLFRVIWSFIHANWNEVLEQKLYEAMLVLKTEIPRSEHRRACNYARRFFGILTRRYRRESRRTSALERVERDAKSAGFSVRVVLVLRDAANQAYRHLADTGRLDWEPTPEELVKARGHAPRVLKAETRLELDEVRPMEATGKVFGLIDALAVSTINTRLDELKVDFSTGKRHYFTWTRQLVLTAHEHGTDSPEWKALVEAWAPRLAEPEFAREAAQIVADIYNTWKVKFSPKPA